MEFRDVIALWPKVAEFASDIGENYERVRKWKTRNSIPPEYWGEIIRASQRRGYGVTSDLLTQIAKNGSGAAAA